MADKLREYVSRRNQPPEGWDLGLRPVPTGPDVEGLSPDEAAWIKAQWARQVGGKEPTARADVADIPAPIHGGEGLESKGTITRGKATLGELPRAYPLFERSDAPKRPTLKSLGVEEGDPIVGQRRVGLEGLGFEKIYKLQKDLNAAKDRLSRRLEGMPPDSPKAKALEQELQHLQESSGDMARLAQSIGTVQGKRFEREAPESHALLGAKPPTYPESEAAARTIEGYQRTGEVATADQISQMKREIERGLTSGPGGSKALVKTVGKKAAARLTKKRDSLITVTAAAESAVVKDTGQAVTQDMVRNPQGHNLGPHALRALNNARKAALAFDAELAKSATSSALRMTQAARVVQGRRGTLKSIRTVTPEKGVKIERVEQLIERPGAKTAKRGTGRGGGRGRGRGLSAMQRRVRNRWKSAVHKDWQASRKKDGFIGWDTFIVYASPTMAEYQALDAGDFGTEGKRPTPDQKEAAKKTLATLRGRYDKEVGTAKTGQLDLVKRQQIKTAAQLETDNNKFTNKMKGDIAKAKRDKAGAEDIRRLEHALKVRLEKIKHNHKVLPYYTDKYLQDKFGEVKKLRKEKGGTPVDVPDIPVEEGAAPKADPKLAAAVTEVERAIAPKSNESLSDYRKRVGPLYAKVAKMQTEAARGEARRLKNLMTKLSPPE
jgi:hypothetical protein